VPDAPAADASPPDLNGFPSKGNQHLGLIPDITHAPILLPIIRIAIAFDPTKAYGTAMTTVQAFYMALGAADGEEAIKFVVPEKNLLVRFRQGP
jgi:hypothetical protein